MKLILVTIAVTALCFWLTGSSAQEPSTTPRPHGPSFPSKPLAEFDAVDSAHNPAARIFFSNSDPCTNSFYSFLNIGDLKCSVQCYVQGGSQNGGYCDDSNVCQCIVVG